MKAAKKPMKKGGKKVGDIPGAPMFQRPTGAFFGPGVSRPTGATMGPGVSRPTGGTPGAMPPSPPRASTSPAKPKAPRPMGGRTNLPPARAKRMQRMQGRGMM